MGLNPSGAAGVVDETDLPLAEPLEQRAGPSQDKAGQRTVARPHHVCAIGKETGEGGSAQRRGIVCLPETTTYVPIFISSSPCSAKVV